MNRKLKQLIYGFFYLLIIAGVVFVGYLAFQPNPTCNDQKQNQGETGVDCGGPCVSCAFKNLEDLQITQNSEIFNVPGEKTVTLTSISNPNNTYGAKFDYSVKALSREGSVLDDYFGSALVFPSDNVYIHQVFEGNVDDFQVEILDTEWIEKNEIEISKPEIRSATTSIQGSRVLVEGTLFNPELSSLNEVKIVSLFRGETGFGTLLSSQTVVRDLGAKEEREFSISAPLSSSTKEALSPQETKFEIILND